MLETIAVGDVVVMTPDTDWPLPAVAPALLVDEELPPEQPPIIATMISHSVSRALAAGNFRPCIPCPRSVPHTQLRSEITGGCRYLQRVCFCIRARLQSVQSVIG
jgi:hypothetical protein